MTSARMAMGAAVISCVSAAMMTERIGSGKHYEWAFQRSRTEAPRSPIEPTGRKLVADLCWPRPDSL